MLEYLCFCTITGAGGARPYKEFSFSPLTGSTPAATKIANNNEADFDLTKGTYIIQVKDANDCTATATLEVPDAKPLQVEVLDLEPCFPGANGGRLQLKATSGNGEYKFSKMVVLLLKMRHLIATLIYSKTSLQVLTTL